MAVVPLFNSMGDITVGAFWEEIYALICLQTGTEEQRMRERVRSVVTLTHLVMVTPLRLGSANALGIGSGGAVFAKLATQLLGGMSGLRAGHPASPPKAPVSRRLDASHHRMHLL